jgi:hypothetical protein
MNDHFKPVEKPAPPRPLSWLDFTSSIISFGSFFKISLVLDQIPRSKAPTRKGSSKPCKLVNILSSLLAKRSGASHTVALINLPVFIPLFNSLDLEGVVSPPMLTASSILQEVRSGQIEHVHSIIEEFGEVISFEALKSSSIVGKPLKDIKLPKDVSLGAIVKKDINKDRSIRLGDVELNLPEDVVEARQYQYDLI